LYLTPGGWLLYFDLGYLVPHWYLTIVILKKLTFSFLYIVYF